MTDREHKSQVSRVLASELRHTHPDVYKRHPLSSGVTRGEPTIGSLSQSVRELGEMLAAADQYPVYRERLAELDRLCTRAYSRLGELKHLVDGEYRDMIGACDEA